MLLAGPNRPGVGFRSEVIALVDSATGLVGRSVWTDEHGEQVFSELQGEGTADRNRITGNPRAGVILTNTEDIAATGNRFTDNVVDGAIHVANLSASRTPASANCWVDAAATAPAGLADQLEAACSGGSAAQAAADSLDGPEPPRGVSFLKVGPPLDQPQLTDSGAAARLPATVDMPSLESITLPDAQLLAERSGTR
jgi:hypothetical protein